MIGFMSVPFTIFPFPLWPLINLRCHGIGGKISNQVKIPILIKQKRMKKRKEKKKNNDLEELQKFTLNTLNLTHNLSIKRETIGIYSKYPSRIFVSISFCFFFILEVFFPGFFLSQIVLLSEFAFCQVFLLILTSVLDF